MESTESLSIMEIVILPTLGFILLATIAYRQSRGFMSLPTICFLYFTCIYIGGLRLWFQIYDNTYLYVLVAAGAFILGISITRKLRRSRPVIAKRPEFAVGLHPRVMFYTVIVLALVSFSIWGYWLWIVGAPLTSGNPSVGWVESGAGALSRLLTSLGGENLAFVGLGLYVLAKVRKNSLYLLFASCCVVGSALFSALQGSKGSAIMTVLWFSIALFYFNRRTPQLKTLVVMGLFAAPVTWWVTSYYVNRPRQTPYSIVYDRITTGELQGLDYLIQTWVPRYGLAHGRTFSMDIARIKAQFLGGPRPVVFHEYIWNLLHGMRSHDSFRLSESLTLFGIGYANFGLLGGILFMMAFGSVCEFLDSSLMTAKRIHFILFAIGVYLINNLIGVLMSGDILIIGLESLLIRLVPKLFAFLAIYSFLALPFRIPLNWWSTSSGKRYAAPGPRGITASAGGNQSAQSRPNLLQENSGQRP
jgi:hypothetical protein